MTQAAAPPPKLDTDAVIDGYDLRFDPGDSLNGSLYLCTPRGAPPPEALIASLRAAGLWSGDDVKAVQDDQREAYRAGLEFVAAHAYRAGDAHVVLARFDHPKFPSDPGRWQAWLDFLEQDHERIQ